MRQEKTDVKGIVYWTSYICMHTCSVFEELGKKYSVVIACSSLEYGNFGGMNFRNVQIVVVTNKDEVNTIINKTIHYIHINNAVKGNPNKSLFAYSLKELISRNCFVMNVNLEQYPYWGWKGFLRRIQWFYLYNIGIGRKVKAIGATGQTGISAFAKAFVSPKRLFDFIYTVPSPEEMYLFDEYKSININSVVNTDNNICNFVYIGQIIDRKCVVQLVDVFNSIDLDYRLYIAGLGNRSEDICRMIKDNNKIYYFGKLMPYEVRTLLSKTDVLLLTSKSEGWGCTVNEGLMYGNRIIVSDRCGSRVLIQGHSDLGTIFRSGDWTDLKRKVECEIKRGARGKEERSLIMKWADCISPKSEAEYLMEVIGFYQGNHISKPLAPWK